MNVFISLQRCSCSRTVKITKENRAKKSLPDHARRGRDPAKSPGDTLIEISVAEHEAYQTKLADLQNQKVESDRLLLEKVASAKKDATAAVFPETRLTQTLDHLVRL